MATQPTEKRTLVSRLPFFGSQRNPAKDAERGSQSSATEEGSLQKAPKWSFGVLNDVETVEVPGKHLSSPSTMLFYHELASEFHHTHID